MQLIRKVILLSAFFIFFYSSLNAEEILLKSGGRVKGKIIETTPDHIKVNVSGLVLTYFTNEIKNSIPKANGENVVPPTGGINNLSSIISKEEISSVLNQYQEAINKQDLKALSDLLWADAKFVLKDSGTGKEKEFSVSDYLRVAENSWHLMSGYVYQYKMGDIKLEGSRAICHGTPEETITTKDGRTIISKADSEDIFEKRNGIVKKSYHLRQSKE